MALFSNRHDEFDLRDEVATLRKQLAALHREMPKRGAAAWRDSRDEVSDLYDDVSGRIADALPVIRRRARDIEATIRDNPVPALAAVGLAALAVAACVLVANSGKR